jgi:hypothetical protein
VRRVARTLVPLVLLLAAAPPVASAAQHASRVVTVQTVPAVSGLSLTFENRRYVTDSGGRVLIPRAPGVSSTYVRSRATVGSRKLNANTIVRFSRWFTARSESIAGLEVFRKIRWHFVDANGSPVPLRSIGRVVLRSSTGEVFVYRTRQLGQPRWLLSRRVASIHGQVKPKDVEYSMQSITVLGANVVTAGQQKFWPQRDRDVPFELAFFTLTVRGEDALFGSSVGTHARLELPDGRARDLRLVHGKAVVASLPRGHYRITVTDGVYRMPQPLVLSRSQVAVVPVVTMLDVLVVAGGLLLAALGLVFLGRPYLARRAAGRLAARGRVPNPRVDES